VARLPVRPEETARSAAARRESEGLAEHVRPRIPTLTIKITGVPLDIVAVTLDGATIPTQALAAPRLVDPGTHDVFARSTSGGTAETRVAIEEGESKAVELKIVFPGGTHPPAPTASTPATEPATFAQPDAGEGEPSRSRSHVLDWSLLGGGAAVGVAGAVLMIVEVGNATSAKNNRDRGAYNGAANAWTVGLVGTIVGAATAAGGGILFMTSAGNNGARGTQASLWFGLGGNDLRFGGTW
jgi:hypothetical protein